MICSAEAAEKEVDELLRQDCQADSTLEFLCDLVSACDYGTETLSPLMRERAEKLIREAYKRQGEAYKNTAKMLIDNPEVVDG